MHTGMNAGILLKRKYFPVFPGFYAEKIPRFLKQTRIFYGIFFILVHRSFWQEVV
jgi:hypothetical protein